MARECGTGDGADGVRGIVGEVPFVGVGERASLKGRWGCIEIGGGEGGGGVVDRGNVEEVVD